MSNLSKSFIYIVGCVLVFFLITLFFIKRPATEPVTAFEWEKNARLYFVDKKQAENLNCEANTPVNRMVMNAETLGPSALEALINGPTPEESESLVSEINPETRILRFEIIDGIAYVDLDKNLNEGVSGACRVTAIRSQIENTLIDLPDINQVVLSVEGETEGILEP